jgi:hypothetical protein
MGFVGLVSELKVILDIVKVFLDFERDNLACVSAHLEHFLGGHWLGRMDLDLVEHRWCSFLLKIGFETLDLKSSLGG